MQLATPEIRLLIITITSAVIKLMPFTVDKVDYSEGDDENIMCFIKTHSHCAGTCIFLLPIASFLKSNEQRKQRQQQQQQQPSFLFPFFVFLFL